MASLVEHYENRMVDTADRRSTNATTFDKMLDVSYAASQQFRDANAARIVMEAGSGRTRAETNQPTQTSAQNQT